MKLVCPNCNSEIYRDDVNVNTDVAYCNHCTNIFKLSELLNLNNSGINLNKNISDLYSVNENTNMDKPIPLPKNDFKNKSRYDIDISQPPVGVIINKYQDGFEISSTTRSGIAFFLIPFTLMWGGGSMSGIYGSQIFTGKFNLFMSLFGLPFFIGSLFLTGLTLMFTIGKVKVTVKDDDGIIFIGAGTTGIQKFFKVSQTSSVREEIYTNNRSTGGAIIIEGNQRLRFGTMLSSERRYFFVKALKKLLNLD